MAKYLIQASYTAEGIKGLLKDGGTKRRTTVETLLKAVGGNLEAFYFTFGDSDVVAIVDGIDAPTAAAFALNTSASGAVRVKTTVLLTPDEVDRACKTPIAYRAPGA
jgi:uncharacterized protein with GYD domain